MADLSKEEVDTNVLPFLSLGAQPPLRCIAMQYFLGLTGSTDGVNFILANDDYLVAILNILDDKQEPIARDAFLALVNLTTTLDACTKIANLKSHPNLMYNLLICVLQPDSKHADIACMVLSNVSRSEPVSKAMVDLIVSKQDEIGFDKIITAFCKLDHNPHAKLHYIGPVLSNLTQVRAARQYVLDKDRLVIQRLLPFTQYSECLHRRGGIIGTLRNCCFEKEYHPWLLGPKVDILPRLLLPLAGPEEFDEEDMDKLPSDLQYLEPDKEREPDPDLRCMLVEAVNQLCSTKDCRAIVKDKNTYVILRELHKWEKDPAAVAAVENLVGLLISDEPEPGMEDLEKVDIPKDIEDKLQKSHEVAQQEIEKEIRELKLKEKEGVGQGDS